jgi:hypothetical protein
MFMFFFQKVIAVDRFFIILNHFSWPLVVFDSWSLFRGRFSTEIAWVGFRMVVVDRWSLFRGTVELGYNEHSGIMKKCPYILSFGTKNGTLFSPL